MFPQSQDHFFEASSTSAWGWETISKDDLIAWPPVSSERHGALGLHPVNTLCLVKPIELANGRLSSHP